MKAALEWLNDVGKAAAEDMFLSSTKRPPGQRTEQVILAIQIDAFAAGRCEGITEATKVSWERIETAPRDGTIIVGLYQDGEALIVWSDNPICMLGPRNGSYPPGWATAGNDTDRNLPMDPPFCWRHKTASDKNK